ncbi:phage gp36-like protein [Bradyrhizobium yuanmingense]|uniref:gp436 family protein n=1 Tax=Bradyrhizobium yuanmingense TaxID=108015 RepID=UPI003518C76C
MTYATQAELVERFGETMLIDLTDRADPPAGAIDAGVVADALTDTDAMIDGYLLGRYLLPLAATPTLLKDLAKAIAIYKLHRDAVSDKIRSDYEDALKTLRLIASGDIRLNVAGVEPASSGANGVRTTDRPRDFTPDNLKGFI